MLHLDGVTKEFGSVRAVDSVSLSIDSGQMVGIIGRSGAGKSTLLRLINRLADPTRGTITFKGSKISSREGKGFAAVEMQMCHDFPAVQPCQ